MPEIAWRAALDLDPIDIAEPSRAAWLETPVWPEQSERLLRRHAAIAIARDAKPRLVHGDLRHDLARLAAEAPRHATLVLFIRPCWFICRPETAPPSPARCKRSARSGSPARRPTFSLTSPHASQGCRRPVNFLLSVNGMPTAWTDPHGAALAWFG